MADYSLKELMEWNRRIEEIARALGLDFYEQEFEIVSFEDMICCEAYTGMPSHYPHWSFGKVYERVRTLNRYNLSGLPYEMVINANPCIAYLMKDNTLLLQILTMAHVYGHNDFFRNNRLSSLGTRAEYTVGMFKNHADRVRGYIADPGIGYERVERVLNAAHAIRFQTARVIGEKKCSDAKSRKTLLDRANHAREQNLWAGPPEKEQLLQGTSKGSGVQLSDLKKIPLEPEEDLLLFVSRYGRLSDWEKDLLEIVREETRYFIPQIETKIMNEGWASYWHYKILNELGLPQGLHMEFLKRHNQVVRSHERQINPYYIGFKMFEALRGRFANDLGRFFEVREAERDESFIRRYLTWELCSEMNLFEYDRIGNECVVTEVADEGGWKKIRDALALSAGMGSIPLIRVDEWVRRDNMLILEHVYDGRELELNHAFETLKHLVDLWNGQVLLYSVIEGQRKSILCDEQKKISLGS